MHPNPSIPGISVADLAGVLAADPSTPVVDVREHDEYVAGHEQFKAEMKRHFPAEAAAIDRYVELLGEVSARVPKFFAGQAMPRTLGLLYAKLRRWWLPDYCFKSTREVLEGLTRNEQLIAASKIDSAPTIVIDGRFVTSPSQLSRPGQSEPQTQAATLRVMDELVARTLKERAPAPAKK